MYGHIFPVNGLKLSVKILVGKRVEERLEVEFS